MASEVEAFSANSVHTAISQTVTPGGKGTLLVEALVSLGSACRGIAPIAGATGTLFASMVEERSLPFELISVEGMTRFAVSLIDRERGHATVINGPGPNADDPSWWNHIARVKEIAASGECDYFIVAGRPPLTSPDDLVARICSIAAQAGARTVVDVASPSLESTLAIKPWLVKVNRAEALEATGRESNTIEMAGELRRLGAQNAIVTDGPQTIGADFLGERLLVVPPTINAKSAVGCGDCFLAGLLHAFHETDDGSTALHFATAVAAAAAETLAPGEFDIPRMNQLLQVSKPPVEYQS